MKLHLLFIGNTFIYNKPFQEYIIRKIEQQVGFVSSITYFKEKDNTLFLYLEQELNTANKIIIVTTKQTFTTVGKLICTVTSDNQILKGNILIPSKSIEHKGGNYLLNYKKSIINVLHINETQKIPDILVHYDGSNGSIQIFDENIDKESLFHILNPMAKTYDVSIELVSIIDGWFVVDITGKKYGNISKFINAVKKVLEDKVINSSNIVKHIIEKLTQLNRKVSFAESCTGGLLSYYFTKENGASNILDGSLVTYSNEFKENWLGVSEEALNRYGAVSHSVIKEMSEGAMNVSNADYTLSISGIAGDSGGTKEKPIGTVYISVRANIDERIKHQEVKLLLQGDRNYVQEQSTLEAIRMLLLIDKKSFF